MRRVLRVFVRTQRFLMRPWYPLLVSFLVALDLFIFVIPSDALVISAVMAKRRRWTFVPILVAIGSAAGAYVIAVFVQWDADLVQRTFPSMFASSSWQSTEAFLAKYGFWAILALAAGPLPFQPGVIVAALSKRPPEEIFFATVAGRWVKYQLYAWLAAFAPQTLRRIFRTPVIAAPAPSKP